MQLRQYLTILGLLGIGLLIVTNLGELGSFWSAFTRVRWYVVPLVVGVQLASYYYNAGYYQAFFRMNDAQISFRKLFKVALAINFANQAIPAGGVAGATYLSQAVRGQVSPGNAALAQLGRYAFTFISYFLVLALGFILLFSTSDIDKISARFIMLLMLIILAIGLILIMIFSERRRFEQFLSPIVRTINRFGRVILRRHHPVIAPVLLAHFLDEFYHAYNQLLGHKKSWWSLFWWSFGGNIAEVLTVYVVFVSFGQWLNPGIVITAYTLAIMASVLGIFTNGIGVYEAGMVGALAALGVPFTLSLAVVIVYRGLSLLLFLPPGLRYYHKYLGEHDDAAASH